MGTELSVPIEISVCQPPGIDGPGAGGCLSVYIFPPDQKGRIHPEDRENRSGDIDPAVWRCAESQSERGPVHFHMLFLDGVYTENKYGKTRFQQTIAPNQQELTGLVHTISHRVAEFLEREGVLERDEENSYLNLEYTDEDSMQQVLGSSVSYRIAVTTARAQGIHPTDHPGMGRG